MNFQPLKLITGKVVIVDFDSRVGKCKNCGRPIRFGANENNKLIPINQKYGDWVVHFDDCPYQGQNKTMSLHEKIIGEERNQDYLNNL